RLRRRLGPLRDLDVMLAHLQEVAATVHYSASAAWMGDQLGGLRGEEIEDARKRLAVADVLDDLGQWWGVRCGMEEAAPAIDHLVQESIVQQLGSFSQFAGEISGGTNPAGHGEVQKPDPHELRIAGKALRYTLEMAEAAEHPLPRGILKIFKKMQDC